jgi:hypothetical protein
MWFLLGFSGKNECRAWCFDGVVVVKCVVKMVRRMVDFRPPSSATIFNFFSWLKSAAVRPAITRSGVNFSTAQTVSTKE